MTDENGCTRKLLKLIKVVDEVAFRADLLALQASVAGSGAGEHSLAFAQVTEEVRDLACRGAQAARDAGAPLQHFTPSRMPSPVGEGELIS